MRNRSRARLRVTAIAMATIALIALAWQVTKPAPTFHAVAYFASANGLYEGDFVTIMGVRVGKVTKIVPESQRVRVEFIYDRPVPADVKAVIAAPSLVPVRTLTLTPAYTSGPKLAPDATIPLSRTATPVEWDDVKEQLNALAVALGPRGTDKKGALSRAVGVASDNLDGNGHDLRAMLEAMSEATGTLADHQGDVFATVRNLQVFVAALSASDASIVSLNRRLAAATRQLAGNDAMDLAGAIRGAATALRDLRRFFNKNQEQLERTIGNVAPVTALLAEERGLLSQILHAGPTGLSNLYGMLDPINGTATGAVALGAADTPATLVCSLLQGVSNASRLCHDALTPLASLVDLPQLPGLTLLVRDGRSNMVVARPGPEPPPGSPAALDGLEELMAGADR